MRQGRLTRHVIAWFCVCLLAWTQIKSTLAAAQYRYNISNGKGWIYVDVCQTTLSKLSAGTCRSTQKTNANCMTISVSVVLEGDTSQQTCGVKRVRPDARLFTVTVRSHAHMDIISDMDKHYTVQCDFNVRPSQAIHAQIVVNGKTRRPIDSLTTGATAGTGRLSTSTPQTLLQVVTTLLLLKALALR